jgi:acyl carrier protein
LDKDRIFAKLKEILVSEFNVDPELIDLDKRLYEDLQLDSLDAVDLVVSLGNHINKNAEPTMFKDVRTVQDVLDLLQPIRK